MIKNSILGFFFVLTLISVPNFSQTLDQQLRKAQSVGQVTEEEVKKIIEAARNPITMSNINTKQFFKTAPEGISSLFSIPELIEEVKMGFLTVFYPKGYGKNPLHYGIWNAIPFVVFDNNTLELRFGLIFEHRQVGFVPDNWVSTSITGKGFPEINFLIPDSKTFLSFAHGSSQWRSTVLLTDAQIKNLELYTKDNVSQDPTANIFTVSHRFVDSSSRPYLIGVKHKYFFKMMLEMYKYIAKNPTIKTFKGSDEFPAGAFFDELSIKNVITQEKEIVESVIENEGGDEGYEEGGDEGYEEGGDEGYEEGGDEGYEEGGDEGYEEGGDEGYEEGGDEGYEEGG
ncbi:MAG: hypothetical protein KFW21_04060, partial [Spirochaetota bacterium]|nr:hypothetical protein [Spirochaetota bacterium]